MHARSLAEAERLLDAIRHRPADCGLEFHPEKTKIFYCKDDDRRGDHEHTKFDFLGSTLRPRRAKNRWGKLFICFLPGVSTKVANSIRETIRSWRIGGTCNNQSLEEIAHFVNPFVRGWVNYYSKFYPSALTPSCAAWNTVWCTGCAASSNDFVTINDKPSTGGAVLLARSRTCSCYGYTGYALRLDNKSRMSRKVPVRFCEGLGTQFLRATRLVAVRANGHSSAACVPVSRTLSRSRWSAIGESISYPGCDLKKINPEKTDRKTETDAVRHNVCDSLTSFVSEIDGKGCDSK